MLNIDLLLFLLIWGLQTFLFEISNLRAKVYIPSTLKIDLILWDTHLIVCAIEFKSRFKSWVIHFTIQAYILPHTLNCIPYFLQVRKLFKGGNYSRVETILGSTVCVSLFEFHI